MAERQRLGERLAESVLDAAGSLLQLQEELDRISLHHDSSAAAGIRAHSGGADTPPSASRAHHPSSKKHHSRRSERKRERRRAPGVLGAVDSRGRREGDVHDDLSLGSNESCEQQSFSASGSSSRYDSAIGSLHSQTDNDSLDSRLSISAAAERRPPSHSLSSPANFHSELARSAETSVRNTAVQEAIVEHYYSPEPLIPTLIIAENAATNEPKSSNESSEESLQNEVVVMGGKVQLRQKNNRQKVHNPLTAEDVRKHFEWLESSGRSVDPTNDINPDKQSAITGFESEGSSSTVVAEEEEIERDETIHKYHKRPKSESVCSEGLSLSLSESLPQQKGKLGKQIDSLHPPSTQVNMPQRYNTGLSAVRQERTCQGRSVQRAPSILQRLRRQRGSFRQDQTRSQRRRIPVQRSLSDRFVYHLKKKWETSPQDNPYSISTPSRLRPIGRLLRTYTGRLHVIQLHKPTDGYYGIYITQGAERKIFISRFANPTAEKFYAGLLSPGDELVSVNKVKVRGKSLDYVYSILSELDSVIIAVVPVTAHRNW